MARPLRLIVCGASGRMGTQVACLAKADPRFIILAGVIRAPRAVEGCAFPLLSNGQFQEALAEADIVIDFSAPAASARFARQAAGAKRPIVIGTTGFSAAERSRLDAAARKTAIFLSPNFSPGMNVAFHLAARAAAALAAFDACVCETHHKAKKDAPSGTALRLAEAVESVRPKGPAVPLVSQRVGDVIGEHTLTLAGPFERLELTHRAHSREVFALGALAAAKWLAGRRPGLYGMRDLLGLG